ncbi:MAG: hypothetical protein LPK02_07125 [Rhodobacterales bacterium]|nr:hypothetical protein [Rhodobacterales bacterium]
MSELIDFPKRRVTRRKTLAKGVTIIFNGTNLLANKEPRVEDFMLVQQMQVSRERWEKAGRPQSGSEMNPGPGAA